MLTILDWLKERQANCIRIAKTKQRQDRQGWLEDAAYFQAAIEAVVAVPQVAAPALEPEGYKDELSDARGVIEALLEECYGTTCRLIERIEDAEQWLIASRESRDMPPVAGHPDTATTRQSKVMAWALDSFGPIAANRDERAARLVEEAIEVCQVEGLEADIIRRILERVYANPPGELFQEIGGLAITLDALAENAGLDVSTEAERELVRITSKPKDWWARKHAAKVAAGTANLSPEKPAEPAREWRVAFLSGGIPCADNAESMEDARSIAGRLNLRVRYQNIRIQSRTPATDSRPAVEWQDEKESPR